MPQNVYGKSRSLYDDLSWYLMLLPQRQRPHDDCRHPAEKLVNQRFGYPTRKIQDQRCQQRNSGQDELGNLFQPREQHKTTYDDFQRFG
jgi:hypothetical protein